MAQSFAAGFFGGLANQVTKQNDDQMENQTKMDDFYKQQAIATSFEEERDKAKAYNDEKAKQDLAASKASQEQAQKDAVKRSLFGNVNTVVKSGDAANGVSGGLNADVAGATGNQSQNAPGAAGGAAQPAAGSSPAGGQSAAQPAGQSAATNAPASPAPVPPGSAGSASGASAPQPQANAAQPQAPHPAQSPQAAPVQTMSSQPMGYNTTQGQPPTQSHTGQVDTDGQTPSQQQPVDKNGNPVLSLYQSRTLINQGLNPSSDDLGRVLGAKGIRQALTPEEQSEVAEASVKKDGSIDTKKFQQAINATDSGKLWNAMNGRDENGKYIQPPATLKGNDPLQLYDPTQSIEAHTGKDRDDFEKNYLNSKDSDNGISVKDVIGTNSLLLKQRMDVLNNEAAVNKGAAGGPGAGALQTLTAAAASLSGKDITEDDSNKLLNSMIGLTNSQAVKIPGQRVTNAEFNQVIKQYVQAGDSPTSRQAVLDYLIAKTARDQQFIQFANEYRTTNRTVAGATNNPIINEYMDANPVMKPDGTVNMAIPTFNQWRVAQLYGGNVPPEVQQKIATIDYKFKQDPTGGYNPQQQQGQAPAQAQPNQQAAPAPLSDKAQSVMKKFF